MNDEPNSLSVAPEPEGVEAIALRVAYRKWAITLLSKADKEDRAALADRMKARARMVVTSPLDDEASIAEITKTKVDHKAEVTDEDALVAWLADRYSEFVESTWTITGRPDEVIDVLLLHAPDLVEERRSVKGWALKEILAPCELAKTPIGPGGETDMPGVAIRQTGGIPQVRFSDQAGVLIGQLWRGGRIELDGTVKGEIES